MTTTTIPFFVQHVTAQLGQSEHPLGSNNTKYGVQFGENDVSWCVEFGFDMYEDCGVVLPIKTAGCVVMWDAAAKRGLTYASTNCVPGDSIIRTWEHKSRADLNPALTHFQVVVGVHRAANGAKMLDLIGGNQGPGVVSRDMVVAGDPSVLGGLGFHRLFSGVNNGVSIHDPEHDTSKANLPAAKSHKYPTAMLSLGSHGDLVVALQHHLQHLGYYKHSKVDGSFGPETLAAVIQFQRHTWPHDQGQWDGVVGPNTYKALGF